MAFVGHRHDEQGRSAFRVFAPEKASVAVVLTERDIRLPLAPDDLGFWHGTMPALPGGTLYLLEVDGQRYPDPASRRQPLGVHGPSMVVGVQAAHSPGWKGVAMADAIIYELHIGTFTAEGTIAAAGEKLPHLHALGITVIELLPIAAFPGERNWGYDGSTLFALHAAYGEYGDLKRFIESAHALGMAVILDVVYNHFGPEGNYAGAFAPYTKAAATPWGAAVNFDGEYNYGVREFFIENTRWWLQDVGFDGFRMDAVSLIFDVMPVHILREITDLAREIGRHEGREILMIAEHLRNNRYVTADSGFGYHAQWNDDVNHALFAHLTGEAGRHYANFGAFDDVVKALRDGFVLDGTRFDKVYRYLLGTDGSATTGTEHVVHIQNHDQVGNRLHGDRMIATHGTEKALLAITAVMASRFVPMIFMGEEFGEEAPFLFFEDFTEQVIVDGAREGRKADFAFAGIEPRDPHHRQTFVDSKLQWQRCETEAGRAILAYYRRLIAWKRSGAMGPRNGGSVTVSGDTLTGIVTIQTAGTLAVLNFSSQVRAWSAPQGWRVSLRSMTSPGPSGLKAFEAVICEPAAAAA
jgi:maltooligosyltrehalose trehalohydrolase